MPIRVQPLEADSADLAARFIAALLEELSGGEPCDPAPLEPVARDLLASGRVCGFAAYSLERPVGVLMLNKCAAVYAGGRFGEITELFVEPEWRSQGTAAALVDAAAEHGRRQGWKRLEVGAPDQPAWQRTLAFYQRCGFTEVGPRLRFLL
ncbi:hypothetical protein RA19_07070 [Leisingera sp. ANG-M1]|uniref:GNAT family N-acetyltransferase n=1 Tax=Leisingera sp. ANG-M1 TaxID=1577895 RepID=UPI00057F3F3E|nr:GNAT family N-acetyltransferase [Leisingera sp. ANG-M1]KIC11118.1 hypothetical protein RA19_07070 [Leisingera sp. ANG-M1]